MWKPIALMSAAVVIVGLLCGCQNRSERTFDESRSTLSPPTVGFSGTAESEEGSASLETTEGGTLILDQSEAPNSSEKIPGSKPRQQRESEEEDSTPASFAACSIRTSLLDTLGYWLYIPSDPTADMPLIVYLHGGSGKGDDLDLITAVDGFPQYLQNGQLGDVRAYVIIPQLPNGQKGWTDIAESIVELIDQTVSTYEIDKNNISLTGHSMGGTGTWSLACAYPNLFARIAPLSGSVRNTPNTVDKLKNTPVKAFVGGADTIVSPEYSEKMVRALQAAGGSAEITVFDGADHFAVPGLAFLDTSIDLVGWLIGG